MDQLIQFYNDNLLLIWLLVFTIILGFQVISKVPSVPPTPPISPDDFLTLGIGTLGIILGMTNVMGGFAVTNRMLEMFKKKKD